MPGPGKTVYVIGAGFSREAQFPLQAEILGRVLEFEVDVIGAPRHTLEVFLPAREVIQEFFRRVFGPGLMPSLEDLFTLLDLSIARRESCKGYAWRGLEDVRDSLKRSILFVFHQAAQQIPVEARSFYQAIGAYLAECRMRAGQDGDPFAVVSLNWDSLLEDSIFATLNQLPNHGRADIDYTCYTTPLGETTPHTPSLTQKARGLYNIKTMKLHGSVNWLVCPNCGRLYTGVGGAEDVWDQYVLPRACPICEQIERPEDGQAEAAAPSLEPFFITPSFLKVFDNAHIQMTWHNAYIDLAEATEVVFIGYSLPEADYHVRTLLRRAIGPGAEIVVVLTRNDNRPRAVPRRLEGMFPASRFRSFFGHERVRLELGGVRAYFENTIGIGSLADRIEEIRRHLELVV